MVLFQIFITSTRHALRSNTFQQLIFATCAVSVTCDISILQYVTPGFHMCHVLKKKFKTIFFYLESFSLSQGLAWRANKHLRFPCSGCQISNSPAQMSSLRLRHFCFILYRVSHFRQLSRIFSREGDLQIQLEFIKICSLRGFFEKVPFVQVDISNSIMLSKSVQ